jgi:hypothetical protein
LRVPGRDRAIQRGANRLPDIRDIEVERTSALAVQHDGELRAPLVGLHVEVREARNPTQPRGDLTAELLELPEVVADDVERDRIAGARRSQAANTGWPYENTCCRKATIVHATLQLLHPLFRRHAALAHRLEQDVEVAASAEARVCVHMEHARHLLRDLLDPQRHLVADVRWRARRETQIGRHDAVVHHRQELRVERAGHEPGADAERNGAPEHEVRMLDRAAYDLAVAPDHSVEAAVECEQRLEVLQAAREPDFPELRRSIGTSVSATGSDARCEMETVRISSRKTSAERPVMSRNGTTDAGSSPWQRRSGSSPRQRPRARLLGGETIPRGGDRCSRASRSRCRAAHPCLTQSRRAT